MFHTILTKRGLVLPGNNTNFAAKVDSLFLYISRLSFSDNRAENSLHIITIEDIVLL